MPSFVLPWVFGAAVAASVGVVALHLLSVRTPTVLVLPTARFVVAGEARAVARQPRLNDVALLLLRVLALLAAGAALAGIRWSESRASRLRLVMVDDALRADSAWRDSVTQALSRDDALVEVRYTPGLGDDPGTAIVAATRRAAQLTARVPSLSVVELTVVLPSTAGTMAGYAAWRRAWPGAVQAVLHPVAAAEPIEGSGAARVRGGDRDDVVAAAFATPVGASVPVLIERGRTVDAVDRELVVRWPADGVPAEWQVRTSPDTVGALAAGGAVVVGPFARVAEPGPALRARIDSGAKAAQPVRVIAWWGDGEPAAVEERVAGGTPPCTRTVAVHVPRGSDVLLTSSARTMLQAVTAPCGEPRVNVMASLAGTGTEAPPAPASAFRTADARAAGSDPWWLTPVLLGIAVTCLLIEWRARDGESGA
jgi:peptidoglycan hydrolase-like protein with peptidoglycan-binding domain